MKIVAMVLALFAALGASRRAEAACGCSANPGTVTSDAIGACITYASPAGTAFDITYRFDTAYACGQYATGEYFVVVDGNGHAVVTSISPPMGAGTNGAAVNPSGQDRQPWDSRAGDYAAPTISFPHTGSAGESIVKYASKPTCNGASKSCGQSAAVLTLVSAAPASPANTFRPPFVGTYKPTFTVDQLQTQLLGRLDGSCCSAKLSRARAEKQTRYFRLNYITSSTSNDLFPPDDGTGNWPWTTDLWAADTNVVEWLNLGNVCDSPPCTEEQDRQAKLQTLIGFVQVGIDTWAGNKMGTSFERGGGGNGGGMLFWYVFAATMLDSQEMLTDLAAVQEGHFFETESYYRGNGVGGGAGPALWGQLAQGSEADYWDNLGQDPAAQLYRTIRDPYGFIDGGGRPGTSYQENTSMPTVYTALIMELVPALATNWPINSDVMIEYGNRWMAHKAHAVPDPCAPKTGTYGVNYGPDGHGGCIPGAGRLPQYDGTQAGISDRGQAFGDEMWNAYHACAATCTCAGQVCTTPPHPVDGAGGGDAGGGGSSSPGGCCEAAGAGAPSSLGILMFGAVLGTVLRRRRSRSWLHTSTTLP
jgi:hypothetical protein